VDLFFTLSGYLISDIALRHSRSPRFLTSFYLRRGLRIWPIYYLTLAMLLVVSPLLPRPCDLAGLPYALSYTQNVPRYWSGPVRAFSPYLDHTWSLAVEEQFYLVWPFLISLVGRRGLIPLALAGVATGVAARVAGWHWWLLLTRLDGLALGSLLAALLYNREGVLQRSDQYLRGFAALGLAAALALAVLGVRGGIPSLGMPHWPAATVLAFGLFGFSLVGVAVSQTGQPWLRVLRSRGLRAVGRISYGLYLYQYVIFTLGDDLARRFGLTGRPFWRELLMLAATVALAVLSWRCVERPALALKARFPYGMVGPPGRPTAPVRRAAELEELRS
jgi:peptidoglycan/LPS O-acetylase OafA/YrhL